MTEAENAGRVPDLNALWQAEYAQLGEELITKQAENERLVAEVERLRTRTREVEADLVRLVNLSRAVLDARDEDQRRLARSALAQELES